jgi:DnaJ-class molecular chaperone
MELVDLLRRLLGFFQRGHVCPRCRGTGGDLAGGRPCRDCGGTGRVRQQSADR